jgi:hypothetical protein
MNQQNIGRDHTARKSCGGFASRVPLALFLLCTGLLLQGCNSTGTLRAVKLGGAQGEIMSDDFQFSCPAPSPECGPAGIQGDLTLMASPASGSVFRGWGWQGQYFKDDTFKLRRPGLHTVYAAFYLLDPPPTVRLTYTRAGGGTGIIKALLPGKGACGPDCLEYDGGTIVFLSADPEVHSKFAGWDGCDHVDGGWCVVALSGDRSVTARFAAEIPLTVSLPSRNTGKGKVEMASGGRTTDCTWRDEPCTEVYDSGAQVTLTPTADDGSTFEEWGGDCTGRGPTCVVSMDGDKKEVSARFTDKYPLTLVRVTSSRATPLGTVVADGTVNTRLDDVLTDVLSCGSGCASQSTSLTVGTRVAINAIPTTVGSIPTFSGGCVSQIGNTCFVTVPKGGITITVTFKLP